MVKINKIQCLNELWSEIYEKENYNWLLSK